MVRRVELESDAEILWHYGAGFSDDFKNDTSARFRTTAVLIMAYITLRGQELCYDLNRSYTMYQLQVEDNLKDRWTHTKDNHEQHGAQPQQNRIPLRTGQNSQIAAPPV